MSMTGKRPHELNPFSSTLSALNGAKITVDHSTWEQPLILSFAEFVGFLNIPTPEIPLDLAAHTPVEISFAALSLITKLFSNSTTSGTLKIGTSSGASDILNYTIEDFKPINFSHLFTAEQTVFIESSVSSKLIISLTSF